MIIGLKRFVATVGGIGYLPVAPGTWAAIFTSIVWLITFKTFQSTDTLQLIILPAVIIAGVYCSGKIINNSDKDPSYIVIDEVAGMCLTLLFITPTYQNIIAGLILFRFFDIVKPLGIKRMEKIRNGWGIMMDDVLAGFYANVVLRLLIVIHIW